MAEDTRIPVVLLVDDSPSDMKVIDLRLMHRGIFDPYVLRENNAQAAISQLTDENSDWRRQYRIVAAICDHDNRRKSKSVGTDVLRSVREAYPDATLLLISSEDRTTEGPYVHFENYLKTNGYRTRDEDGRNAIFQKKGDHGGIGRILDYVAASGVPIKEVNRAELFQIDAEIFTSYIKDWNSNIQDSFGSDPFALLQLQRRDLTDKIDQYMADNAVASNSSADVPLPALIHESAKITGDQFRFQEFLLDFHSMLHGASELIDECARAVSNPKLVQKNSHLLADYANYLEKTMVPYFKDILMQAENHSFWSPLSRWIMDGHSPKVESTTPSGEKEKERYLGDQAYLITHAMKGIVRNVSEQVIDTVKSLRMIEEEARIQPEPNVSAPLTQSASTGDMRLLRPERLPPLP